MPWRRSLALAVLLALTAAEADGHHRPAAATVIRVNSGTPGHEVGIRGVILFLNQPMQLVEHATPFEFRADRPLVFAAFEPVHAEVMLRLELISNTPERAVVTAPRVMVGQRIGGVATEFVQGY
jgi:hypothetical protein